jgi:cell fate regulator YaaT (PSP1 superfamily)
VEEVCAKSHNHGIKLGSHPSNSSLILKLYKSNNELESCTITIESTNDHQIQSNIKQSIESQKSDDIKNYNNITFTKMKENKLLLIEFGGVEEDIQIIYYFFNLSITINH